MTVRSHFWNVSLSLAGVVLILSSFAVYAASWFGFDANPRWGSNSLLDSDTADQLLLWSSSFAPGLGGIGLAVLVAVLFRIAPARPTGGSVRSPAHEADDRNQIG